MRIIGIISLILVLFGAGVWLGISNSEIKNFAFLISKNKKQDKCIYEQILKNSNGIFNYSISLGLGLLGNKDAIKKIIEYKKIAIKQCNIIDRKDEIYKR